MANTDKFNATFQNAYFSFGKKRVMKKFQVKKNWKKNWMNKMESFKKVKESLLSSTSSSSILSLSPSVQKRRYILTHSNFRDAKTEVEFYNELL